MNRILCLSAFFILYLSQSSCASRSREDSLSDDDQLLHELKTFRQIPKVRHVKSHKNPNTEHVYFDFSESEHMTKKAKGRDASGHGHEISSHGNRFPNNGHRMKNHGHGMSNHGHGISNHKHGMSHHGHEMLNHGHGISNHGHGVSHHGYGISNHGHRMSNHGHGMSNHIHGMSNHHYDHKIINYHHEMTNHHHEMPHHYHGMSHHGQGKPNHGRDFPIYSNAYEDDGDEARENDDEEIIETHEIQEVHHIPHTNNVDSHEHIITEQVYRDNHPFGLMSKIVKQDKSRTRRPINHDRHIHEHHQPHGHNQHSHFHHTSPDAKSHESRYGYSNHGQGFTEHDHQYSDHSHVHYDHRDISGAQVYPNFHHIPTGFKADKPKRNGLSNYDDNFHELHSFRQIPEIYRFKSHNTEHIVLGEGNYVKPKNKIVKFQMEPKPTVHIHIHEPPKKNKEDEYRHSEKYQAILGYVGGKIDKVINGVHYVSKKVVVGTKKKINNVNHKIEDYFKNKTKNMQEQYKKYEESD